MTMITPSYLGETIEYSSLHACRSTLEDPTCGRAPFEQSALRGRGGSAPRFPEVITPDPYFGERIMRLHRPSYAQKIWRTCSRYFPSRAGR